MGGIGTHKPFRAIADDDTDFFPLAQSQLMQSAPQVVHPFGDGAVRHPFVLIGGLVLGSEQIVAGVAGHAFLKEIDEVVRFDVIRVQIRRRTLSCCCFYHCCTSLFFLSY